MDKKILEEKIKNQKNANLITEFEYNNKKYVKTFKDSGLKITYEFYEIDGDKILDISDKNTLKYLDKTYNIHEDVNY